MIVVRSLAAIPAGIFFAFFSSCIFRPDLYHSAPLLEITRLAFLNLTGMSLPIRLLILVHLRSSSRKGRQCEDVCLIPVILIHVGRVGSSSLTLDMFWGPSMTVFARKFLPVQASPCMEMDRGSGLQARQARCCHQILNFGPCQATRYLLNCCPKPRCNDREGSSKLHGATRGVGLVTPLNTAGARALADFVADGNSASAVLRMEDNGKAT
jgi:hypothetical protein